MGDGRFAWKRVKMLFKCRFYDVNYDKLSWASTKMIEIKDINQNLGWKTSKSRKEKH